MSESTVRSPSRRSQGRSPKHEKVRERLRHEIETGRWAPGMRLPPETELPARFQTGKQTVVRALNDLVREGLIVRRRGSGTYVADRAQPPLIQGRHVRLGLLWHRSVWPRRMAGHFQGDMTRGALKAWGLDPAEAEWDTVNERQPTVARWASTTRGVTVEALGESHYSRQRHPSLQAVKDAGYDGLIALSVIEDAFLEAMLNEGLPAVLVDYPNERFALQADQVYVDPATAYRQAVRRLYDSGKRRIHFVGSRMVVNAPSEDMTPAEVVAFQEGKGRVDPDTLLRLSAFRHGMDECGLSCPTEAVHYLGTGVPDLESLADTLCALQAERRPEALICHSLGHAEALMRACAERGMPVEAAGATDQGYGGPAMSLRTRGEELGRVAAELLLWRLLQPDRSVLRVGVPMVLEHEPENSRNLPQHGVAQKDPS